MKKLTAILCLSALAAGVFAQGLVTFANGPTTLVSYGQFGAGVLLPANSAGSFYFGLLISSSVYGPYTFANVYATNSASAGLIGSASYSPAVPGWAPGAIMFYEVAGWSKNLGATWNNGWTKPNGQPVPATSPVWAVPGYYFGVSGISTGAAGGGTPPAPPLPLFGNPGILFGFNLNSLIPEPNSMALAGLGAAALLIFRRRK